MNSITDAIIDIFTSLKIPLGVFWVVTPFIVVVGFPYFG
jgi:hypothetical protein